MTCPGLIDLIGKGLVIYVILFVADRGGSDEVVLKYPWWGDGFDRCCVVLSGNKHSTGQLYVWQQPVRRAGNHSHGSWYHHFGLHQSPPQINPRRRGFRTRLSNLSLKGQFYPPSLRVDDGLRSQDQQGVQGFEGSANFTQRSTKGNHSGCYQPYSWQPAATGGKHCPGSSGCNTRGDSSLFNNLIGFRW